MIVCYSYLKMSCFNRKVVKVKEIKSNMHKGYMHTHKKYLNGHIITTYFLRNYDYRFFCFSSQLSNFLPKKMEKMNNTHTQE